MHYSDLLKLLIQITNLKLKDLSSDLHYDSSYLSKWLNGHLLPSQNQSEATNIYLASRFADVISSYGLHDEIRHLFPKYVDLGSSVILKRALYNALNTAYCESSPDYDETMAWLDSKELHTLSGFDTIQRFLYSLYSRSLGDEKVSLFYHVNSSYLLRLFYDFKNLLVFSTDTPVDMHFILDQPSDFFASNKFYDVFSLLSEMAFYDLFAYKRPLSSGQPEFIYVRDHFVLFFHMDSKGLPFICNYVTNPDVLEGIEKYLETLELHQNVLMQTIDDPYFEVDFFRDTNYREHNFHIFASLFDDSFIDENMLSKILKRNRMKTYERTILQNTLKLKKATYLHGNMTITINAAPFFRSFKEHKLALGSHMLNLRNDDIKDSIQLMVDGLNLMQNSRFYIVDPLANLSMNWDFPLSFYMTEHTFVAKKQDPYSKGRFKYIVATNHEFVDLLHDSFDLIKDASYAKEVNPTRIKERLWSTYNAMEALGDNKM